MFQPSKLLLSILFFVSALASLNCYAETQIVEIKSFLEDTAGSVDDWDRKLFLNLRPGTVVVLPDGAHYLVSEENLLDVRYWVQDTLIYEHRLKEAIKHDFFVQEAQMQLRKSYERLTEKFKSFDQIARGELRTASAATGRAGAKGTSRVGRGKAGVIAGAAIGVGAAIGSMGGDEANASEMSLYPVEPAVAQ